MKNIEEKIITHIKQKRRTLMLTQAQMSEKIGLTPVGYQAIESGRNGLTFQNFEKIAGAFGMSDENLMKEILALNPTKPDKDKSDKEEMIDMMKASLKLYAEKEALIKRIEVLENENRKLKKL